MPSKVRVAIYSNLYATFCPATKNIRKSIASLYPKISGESNLQWWKRVQQVKPNGLFSKIILIQEPKKVRKNKSLYQALLGRISENALQVMRKRSLCELKKLNWKQKNMLRG